MDRRSIAGGLAFAAALAVTYGLIVWVLMNVPGAPHNDAARLAGELANEPAEAELQAWFASANRMMFVDAVILPAVLGLLAGLVRLRVRMRPATMLITGAAWLAFFAALVGFGVKQLAGMLFFAAMLVLFDFLARRRESRFASRDDSA